MPLVYVDINQGIPKRKSKVAWKYMDTWAGFLIHKNITNLEAFHWNISLSTKLLFLKSGLNFKSVDFNIWEYLLPNYMGKTHDFTIFLANQFLFWITHPTRCIIQKRFVLHCVHFKRLKKHNQVAFCVYRNSSQGSTTSEKFSKQEWYARFWYAFELFRVLLPIQQPSKKNINSFWPPNHSPTHPAPPSSSYKVILDKKKNKIGLA